MGPHEEHPVADLLLAGAAVRPADLGAALEDLPALRQRMTWSGLPFGVPSWHDDPAFAWTRHVQEELLPVPGDDAVLAAVVVALGNRPLPHDRPRWQVHLLTAHGDVSALLVRAAPPEVLEVVVARLVAVGLASRP